MSYCCFKRSAVHASFEFEYGCVPVTCTTKPDVIGMVYNRTI